MLWHLCRPRNSAANDFRLLFYQYIVLEYVLGCSTRVYVLEYVHVRRWQVLFNKHKVIGKRVCVAANEARLKKDVHSSSE